MGYGGINAVADTVAGVNTVASTVACIDSAATASTVTTPDTCTSMQV